MKKWNKMMKIINGNRTGRGRGIKLVAYNKGNSFLQNYLEETESLVEKYRPDLLCLTEANLKKDIDKNLVSIKDYNLHTAPTMNNVNLNISRVVVYTNKNIIAKRRPDLENEEVSAIWLEVGPLRKPKILVASLYREWQYMGQPYNDSGTIQSQLARWNLFLDN